MKPSTLRTCPLILGLVLASPLAAQEPQFIPFGEGCAGTFGTPVLTNWSGDLPQLGADLTLDLRDLPPTGFAVGLIGLPEPIDPGGTLTLPLDGAPFGAPGCTLYTSVRAQQNLLIEGGRSIWNIRIPGDPRLLGFTFFQQALVMDPAANSLGWILSNAAQSTVGDLPDLTITSGLPTANPRTIHPGGWVDVPSFTMKNESFYVDSGPFKSGWLLADSSLIGRSDPVLYSRDEANMAPRENRIVPARSVRIPFGIPAGTYWLGPYVDHENEVTEWREFPNFKTVAITVTEPLTPLPNLTFPDGTPKASPTSVRPGDTLDIASFRIANDGNYPATTFSTGIYLSSELTDITGGTLLGSFSIGGLVQGLPFNTAAQSVVIPSDTPAGSYWLGFDVDRKDQVAELDERDNVVARLITVLPHPTLPDLAITSGTIGLTTVIIRPFLGSSAPASLGTFTVENQGGVHSGPFTVGYYYSRYNETYHPDTEDEIIATVDHPGLAPGESYTFSSKSVILPVRFVGPHNPWVGVMVDYEDLIEESDETNNWTSNRTYIW